MHVRRPLLLESISFVGLVLPLFIVLSLVTPTDLSAGNYVITNLGTLGGSYCAGFVGQNSFTTAINGSGQVTGGSCSFVGFFQPVIHGFLYGNGVMMDVGTIGPAESMTIAYGINNAGQVVGASGVSPGAPDVGGRAFLYSGGLLTDLGSLFSGFSQAIDINDDGQIVGYASSSRPDSWSAFLYSRGLVTDLGMLGGTFRSAAVAINDFGQTAGYASTGGNTSFHAFLYGGGVMSDLGTLGGTHSFATGINNSGVVVGRSYMPGDATEHAFVYTAGLMSDLGTLGGLFSYAYGINDAGAIVGFAGTSVGSFHAFLYEDGTMRDLNSLVPVSPGLVLTGASAINNAGEIAATGTINGQYRAFLLTPSTDTTPPVITVPASLSVDATSSAGVAVTYVINASDPDDTVASLDCEPASGSTFPIGTTTVTCTATDTFGNTASASFTVHVKGPQEQIANLIDVIRLFEINAGIADSLIFSLEDAQMQLERGMPGGLLASCGMLTAFGNHAKAQGGTALTPAQADDLTADATRIKKVLGC